MRIAKYKNGGPLGLLASVAVQVRLREPSPPRLLARPLPAPVRARLVAHSAFEFEAGLAQALGHAVPRALEIRGHLRLVCQDSALGFAGGLHACECGAERSRVDAPLRCRGGAHGDRNASQAGSGQKRGCGPVLRMRDRRAPICTARHTGPWPADSAAWRPRARDELSDRRGRADDLYPEFKRAMGKMVQSQVGILLKSIT